MAQSYVLGARKYAKGDVKGAEAALIQATKRTKNRAELAKVYKLLGITQYMQNKKPQAAASFKAALGIDPRLTIKSDEVLDESVIPYFEAQRGGKPAVAGQAPGRRAPAAVAAPARTPTASKGPRYGKPLNSTILLVTSNAPKASISIDGILAGMVNDRIETQAGTTVLQMKAPGFRTKNFKVTIRAGVENKFTLNLDKIQPKAPPPPKAPVARAGGKKVGKMKASDHDMFGEKEPEYPTAPGGDLMSEFRRDGAPPPAPEPVAPPAPVAPAPVAPAPAPAPQYQAPAVMPAPVVQAPVYAAPPPVYAAPVYPPQYQQPYYPPQYAAPAPMAPAPPPPTDLYSDFQSAPAPAAAPSYDEPPPPLTPMRSRRRRSSGGDTFLVTTGLLMPFGVGQFINGDTMSGLIFMGAQIGSLYFYKTSLDAADAAIKNAEAVVQSGEFSDDEKDTFLTDTEKYVNAQKQNANIGIGLFGVAWVAGSIEAFLTRSARKEAPKRRYSLIDQGLLPNTQGEVLEDLYVAAPEPYAPPVSFGLLPNVQSDRVDWGVGIKLDWRF